MYSQQLHRSHRSIQVYAAQVLSLRYLCSSISLQGKHLFNSFGNKSDTVAYRLSLPELSNHQKHEACVVPSTKPSHVYRKLQIINRVSVSATLGPLGFSGWRCSESRDHGTPKLKDDQTLWLWPVTELYSHKLNQAKDTWTLIHLIASRGKIFIHWGSLYQMMGPHFSMIISS